MSLTHQRFRPVILVAGLGLAATGLNVAVGQAEAAAAPPEPGVAHVHSPAGVKFFDNGATPATFPAVYDLSSTTADGARTSRILLTYGAGKDVIGGASNAGLSSSDDASSWQTLAMPSKFASVGNMFRLADAAGTAVTIDFEPGHGVPAEKFKRWLYTADGWQDGGEAAISYSKPIAGARFQQAPIVLSDGTTVVSTMYGSYADKRPYVIVVRSTDGGKNWQQASTIYEGAVGDPKPFNEASLALASDGRLMAVLRRENGAGGIDLYKSFNTSATGSGNWNAPQLVSGDSGASPLVKTLANGSLVVASGRFDDVVRYSLDGTGNTLTDKATLWTNYPNSNRRNGTTGYQGLTPLAQNRMLVVGDNCRTECPDGTYTGPGRKNWLWKSVVEPDTSQWGLLDLQTKLQRGEISFPNTTFTTYGAGRQSLGAYLFDADPRFDSSAVTADRKITVKLDRSYQLTGIGAYAHLLGATDIAIETSADGLSWTTPARLPRAGILRSFQNPVAAQYLRISDPNPGDGARTGFLSELQVYSATDGFENDYPGQAPRGNGIAKANLATVIDQTAVTVADRISTRFLRLRDTATNASALAKWKHAPTPSATVSFRSRAVGTNNKALLFGIDGPATTDHTNRPYHLSLTAGGYFQRYNPATNTWTQLNTAPIAANAWHDITVSADLQQARLSVDGQVIATVPAAVSVPSLAGNELSSSGTVNTGDDWLIDDLAFVSP